MSKVIVFVKKVFECCDLSDFDDLEEAKDYYEDFHYEMIADDEVVIHVEVEDD